MSEEVLDAPVTNNETKEEKPKKKKKSLARRIVGWVLYGVFGAFFVFVIAGNISGEVNKKANFGQSIRFGYGSFIIQTNSMEPDIAVDSAIITHKDSLESVYQTYLNGNIQDVTFANVSNNANMFTPDNPLYTKEFLVIENRIMTHRIMELHYREDVAYGEGRYVFVTSGINHGGYQSKERQHQIFTEKEYLGIVKVNNPFLGKVFRFITSPVGLLILLLVPALYLIITSTIDIFRAMKQSEAENEAFANAEPSTDRLNQMSAEEKDRLKKELLEEMKQKRKESMKNENKD